MAACEVAGLECVKILNEPTAAAIAAGLHINNADESSEQKVMIFDFGGGTLDVTILKIQNGVFTTLATAGDCHLGGQDIDNALVEHFFEQLEAKEGEDFRGNMKVRAKLKAQATVAKEMLSAAECMVTTVYIDNVVNDCDYEEDLNRAKFELLCKPIMDSILAPLDDAFEASGLVKGDIDRIVLVGGSTRIPIVRERLRSYFDDREVNLQGNPDEDVALGAAMLGGMLARGEQLTFQDVTSLAFGVEAWDPSRSMSTLDVIVPRNTPFPIKKSQRYNTIKANQTKLLIRVTQGKEQDQPISECYKLGDLWVDGLAQGPAAQEGANVTFEIDSNGVLKITAEDVRGGDNNQLNLSSIAAFS